MTRGGHEPSVASSRNTGRDMTYISLWRSTNAQECNRGSRCPGSGRTSRHRQASCEDGEVVIKFSHVTNTDKHPKGIAAELLAKRVNEEMNGKACMQVYPNSSLYNDDKVLEAMLSGDVQLAAPSLSKFEKFTKKFRLFDLPFLFKDIDAVDRFQNSADGQKLKESMSAAA